MASAEAAMAMARTLSDFQLDPECECMGIPDLDDPDEGRMQTFVIPGRVLRGKERELERQHPNARVWSNPTIDPAALSTETIPCTCEQQLTGTQQQMREVLGVDALWNRGLTGEGIVIGIVDGGITSADRDISQDDLCNGWDPERDAIPRVLGGSPSRDWGTRGFTPWRWHGNMTATDALATAPDAKLFDIRIADDETPDNLGAKVYGAIRGYRWAIQHHRDHGTPHVLSNSWALWQEAHYTDYARDIRHPFNRLVSLAVAEGIAVVFAAGNCGDGCQVMRRCGGDSGPGCAIWGANGHPGVMTVGAATVEGEFIGYSSPGPAALAKRKPDFVGLSHFAGYAGVDSGTSAACAAISGVVALLRQARPNANPSLLKHCLSETARPLGTPGFNRYAGHGIIDANAAWSLLSEFVRPCS
jgi:subtilisin family serine protease